MLPHPPLSRRGAAGLSLLLSLCFGAAAQAEVIPLDLTVGYNYDAYISEAEADHAYLYDPAADWNIAGRLVHSAFGEHTPGVNSSRIYAWDDQTTSGLPASGIITTSYGDFQLSTVRDAEPVGGFVQPPVGVTPSLPVASNVVRAYRPHSAGTGNPLAMAMIDLPVVQQGHYDSANFLFSGNDKKVYIYADYDDGFGGVDSQLVYESPGTPKTPSETGFPLPDSGGTPSNPDVVAALTMSELWTQNSSYSDIRGGTATLWTLANPVALDPAKELIGFTLAVHDTDTWRSRTAVLYAISANSVEQAIYVDINNGSDTTGDGSVGNPYQTLQYVLDDVAIGGETIALQDGNYGNIFLSNNGGTADIFSDWVTIKPAPGAAPEINHFKVTGNMGPQDQSGGYNAYLRLEGLILRDGWECNGGKHWGLYNCLIERFGPWTGSSEIIDNKVAVKFRHGSDITIEGCEITNTATGMGGSGHNISVRGNYIHDGTHDGIRVVGFKNAVVEDNIICRFDDGVADGEVNWSRHCDLIHIFIAGPAHDGYENDNVVFRYNVLFDTESQGVQFNNYYGRPDLKNKNITFEYNVFGPTHANLFNNADPVEGLIFRHNTVAYVPGGRTFGRWTLDNHTVRIGKSTDVQVYNNNLVNLQIAEEADMEIFDWNILAEMPSSPVSGVDGRRAYGRFTQLGVDYQLVNAADFDGALQSTSPAINAGTRDYAPTLLPGEDLAGTLIDLRPDIGAWEEPGNSPAAEPLPVIVDDFKTIFVDDFEDGHYKDVDPWLNDVATQGLSWYRPAAFDTFKPFVQLSGQLNRQALYGATGASGQTNVSWLITEQGADWAEYDLTFSASNAYLGIGSGVTVLTIDENNAYWLDISRSNGRLIRILGGVETVLAAAPNIQMPNSGVRDYLVTVRQNGSGITIEVDADDNGSVDFTYTDTDTTALSTFTAGGIGIHSDNANVYQKLHFDDFRVDVVTFAP